MYRSMAEYLKKAVERPKEDLTAVREAVREITTRVKEEGKAAVRYYSGKFDNWSPRSFRVSQNEILDAKKKPPQSEIEDIDFSRPIP